MKQLRKYSFHLGMFLYAAYQIINHITYIPNLIAIPVILIMLIFMLIGLITNRGCFTNGINAK